MEFLSGQMEKYIKGNGQKEGKMQKEKYMILVIINGLLVNGIWEKKLNVMYS